MNDRPNIFRYATKELSQDAFIAWLLSWADGRLAAVDPAMQRAGKRFADALFEYTGLGPVSEIRKVEIIPQYKRIDLVAIINDQYVLAIEDKTSSGEHGSQLRRYKGIVVGSEEHGVKQDSFFSKYPVGNCKVIYFKTGEQPDYSSAEREGYAIFLREDLLKVLNQSLDDGVDHPILTDFLAHLKNLDGRVNAFKSMRYEEFRGLSPFSWGDYWVGLFKELKNSNKYDSAWWGYVHQNDGGFMAFDWHETPLTDGLGVFLQLAFAKDAVQMKIKIRRKAPKEGLRPVDNEQIRTVAKRLKPIIETLVKETGGNLNRSRLVLRRESPGTATLADLTPEKFPPYAPSGGIDIFIMGQKMDWASQLLKGAVERYQVE